MSKFTKQDYSVAVSAIMHTFYDCLTSGAYKTAEELLAHAENFAPLSESPEMYAADIDKAKNQLSIEMLQEVSS